MRRRAGHPDGNVIEDELGPAHVVEYPIAGRKLDAKTPLIGRCCMRAHRLRFVENVI